MKQRQSVNSYSALRPPSRAAAHIDSDSDFDIDFDYIGLDCPLGIDFWFGFEFCYNLDFDFDFGMKFDFDFDFDVDSSGGEALCTFWCDKDLCEVLGKLSIVDCPAVFSRT